MYNLSLLSIDVRIPVVIHRFFSSCRRALLTNLLYTQQIENSLSSDLYEVKQETGSATTLTMCSIKGNFWGH